MSHQRPHDEERAKKIQEMLGVSAASQPDLARPEAAQPPAAPPPVDASVPEPTGDGGKKGNGFVWPDKEKLLRALWTVASVISMTVTVVVIIVAIIAFRYVNKYAKYFPIEETLALLDEKGEALPPDFGIEELGAATEKTVNNFPDEVGLNTPLDLLQGLYDNFEKMDQAHIETTILVKDEIPVQFTLGLNQETTVVLSQAVTIPGARVALTTGGLNIFNAPATVTLPAGTSLPIFLDLEVPVDEMIPVTLNVPVDIALSETDLHAPFVGLQEVVRPLYCLIKPDATNSKQILICEIETPVE